MKKIIFNLLLIILTMLIVSCGDDNKAITDFIPKIGSENLNTQTSYNIFNKSNIARSIKEKNPISRGFMVDEEDKKFVVETLTYIKSILIIKKEEEATINSLLANINTSEYASTINDVYSILKINNITTSSTKEMIKTFMSKISKEIYNKRLLRLNNVIDFSKKIDCTQSLNLSNVYVSSDDSINTTYIDTIEKEAKEKLKNLESELKALDTANKNYAIKKQLLEKDIKEAKEYLNGLEENNKAFKESIKLSIENTLKEIYDIEHYECITAEQIQYGSRINTKKVGDKSFTTIDDKYKDSLYKVSWLAKDKLTFDFSGDLILRLNNHQILESINNQEDYTRIDSRVINEKNKKLYSIFLKFPKDDLISQTFYNIDLDLKTRLPKNQYMQSFRKFDGKTKKETYITYSHFTPLGIAIFSCSSEGGIICNDDSKFSSSYAKLKSSDSSLRAKAKNKSISKDDSSRNFFENISKEMAQKIGLTTDMGILKSKISLTHSRDMSSILSNINVEQDNNFYLDNLDY